MTGKRQKLRILIVDDTKTVRMRTRILLQNGDFVVAEASDGVEALTATKSFRPHIILMDLVMPNMDGLECCRRIKAHPELAQTKIVMVTAQNDYNNIRTAFRAGADDYATKPINASELMKKVDELSTLARVNEYLSGISPTNPSALQHA